VNSPRTRGWRERNRPSSREDRYVIVDSTNWEHFRVSVGDEILNANGEAVGTVTEVFGVPGEAPGRIRYETQHHGSFLPMPTYDRLIAKGWRFRRLLPLLEPGEKPWHLQARDWAKARRERDG